MTRPLGGLPSARELLRRAQAGFRRPPKAERPRCGKPGRHGPCTADAWWEPGEPRPRRRCWRHTR